MKWHDATQIDNNKEQDIRFNLEKSLIKKKSFLTNAFSQISYYLQFVSPTIWYAQANKPKIGENEAFPMWVTEVWIVFKFIILTSLIILVGSIQNLQFRSWFPLQILPIWFLLDNLTAVGRELILVPNFHKNKFYVYDFQRWMILTLLGAIEIILCFSELILYNSSSFVNLDRHPIINSLYFSTVTFITLGYGDIHPDPKGFIGQILVMAELFFFFILLVVKIPFAVSMLTKMVKKRHPEKDTSL